MKKNTESVSILIMAFHISHSSYCKISTFRSRFTFDHNQYFTGIKLLWMGIFTVKHCGKVVIKCVQKILKEVLDSLDADTSSQFSFWSKYWNSSTFLSIKYLLHVVNVLIFYIKVKLGGQKNPNPDSL